MAAHGTSVEFVEDLCARDTLAARTRLLLLRLEKQGHKLGWDHPDGAGIFRVQYHPHSNYVEHHWSGNFERIIAHVCTHNGGNVGAAFQVLAEHVEDAAAGGYEAALPPHLRDIFRRRQPGADLFAGTRPGWKFFGYGHRSEAWAVTPTVYDDLTHRLRLEHRLDEHPDRVEVRQVCFAARDGLLWFINRVRGQEPTVHVERPESDTPAVGGIVNGLSRLTNAVAGNPVPVRPATVPPAFRREG